MNTTNNKKTSDLHSPLNQCVTELNVYVGQHTKLGVPAIRFDFKMGGEYYDSIIDSPDAIEMARVILKALDEQPDGEVHIPLQGFPNFMRRDQAHELIIRLADCAGMIKVTAEMTCRMMDAGFEPAATINAFLNYFDLPTVTTTSSDGEPWRGTIHNGAPTTPAKSGNRAARRKRSK